MNDRFFVDTNVFVYCFDRSAPAKAKRAEKLVREALNTGKGTVSYQVVQEFFNVAIRRFAVPMSLADAQHYLSAVFQPLLAVHSSSELFGEALRVRERYRLAWYDSLLVAAALEASCSVLYSEDMQDGLRVDHLRIRNPFASGE